MATERSVYMGPRLKRLRRELGLTQAQMAADLDISPSYVALIERNQRPLTADLLLRLARTYKLDLAELAGDGGADFTARLSGALKDPMFADIDLPALEISDVAASFPGMGEAFLRLHTAWAERQLEIADRDFSGGADDADPVAEVQRFLGARGNCFPALDDIGEGVAAAVAEAGGLPAYFARELGLRVRRLPSDVLAGSLRRYDRHRGEVLLDETLDGASRNFQLALQAAHIQQRRAIEAALAEGQFTSEPARAMARRALANYLAAAILMPYTAFAKTAEARGYDVEVLARVYGASFEQVAHRLTTLRKPGAEKVSFFFLRVDRAGNVSKRLDGAGFPYARAGGACPLWNLFGVFAAPRKIVTQWLELPDGKRFLSIARAVMAGGGGYGAHAVERAVALVCAEGDAAKLVYGRDGGAGAATPIGVSCRLCQRIDCDARSAPPIGRQIVADDYHRRAAPFTFADQ